MPILSDIDILVNGGLELEEVEIEIKATDEVFVPTAEGIMYMNFSCLKH